MHPQIREHGDEATTKNAISAQKILNFAPTNKHYFKVLPVANYYHILYSWKFSRDLYFKNFVVQTKFVKYKTLKYFKSITLILSIAEIRENCILELANESKFVKYRALENNQLYGSQDYKSPYLCSHLLKWVLASLHSCGVLIIVGKMVLPGNHEGVLIKR